MVKSVFRHIKKPAPQSQSKNFGGQGTPIDFHENRCLGTVFHADYIGEVCFSPHLKAWPPQPIKKIGGQGTPIDFHKKQSLGTVFHADYIEEVCFSPHLKAWPQKPIKKNSGVRGPQ
jgi:hypothetical protein